MVMKRDYSLLGPENAAAVSKGLANAQWYRCDIPRVQMKELIQRRDGPAIRDTLIWLGAFVIFAAGGWYFWGSWACIPFFIGYGVLYGSSSDSRWHECGHGTAFKSLWLNNLVYQIACFMIMREPEIWRWSHTRHHTDTIIVGRDPEIVAMRPPAIFKILLYFFGWPTAFIALKKAAIHATGRMLEDEKTFVPESEWPKVTRTARIWLVIHVAVIAAALALRSWLPLMYVGVLPFMYGTWLSVVFGLTQHAGMAEDVLDHRLCARTVYMNPVFRFVYWNMNYHVEHHMFPMVPYHALPKLHEIMKADTPVPCASTIEAYVKEIIPALIRQQRDPAFTIRRPLPSSAKPYAATPAAGLAVPAE
ncbi:MAG TPA: fatty acid desaturase family protein [Candidatus Cybelea sp.]|nr:fatty acid desaturase family protein [Candidatus Cybelea sp.]